jgi:3,4-dihydroxy-2-butanone 4-phosphate synthase
MRRGEVVTIVTQCGRYLAAAADVVSYETLLQIESEAQGLLCLAMPLDGFAVGLPESIKGEVVVGRAEGGRQKSAVAQYSKANHVVVPIICMKNGVLSRPAPAECATDLARMAGFGPSAILCAVTGADAAHLPLPQAVSRYVTVEVSEVVKCRIALQEEWWNAPCHRSSQLESCAYKRLQFGCER